MRPPPRPRSVTCSSSPSLSPAGRAVLPRLPPSPAAARPPPPSQPALLLCAVGTASRESNRRRGGWGDTKTYQTCPSLPWPLLPLGQSCGARSSPPPQPTLARFRPAGGGRGHKILSNWSVAHCPSLPLASRTALARLPVPGSRTSEARPPPSSLPATQL